MPEHSTFFAYQAHLDETDYIAIPRQVGAETRVEIHPLHNPGIDDVTAAIVAGDGKLLEVSRLVVSRAGHEHSRIIDPRTLPEPTRDAFRRLAVAVLASDSAPDRRHDAEARRARRWSKRRTWLGWSFRRWVPAVELFRSFGCFVFCGFASGFRCSGVFGDAVVRNVGRSPPQGRVGLSSTEPTPLAGLGPAGFAP
jgi:hypothetical protein